jgi:hypothetical protein
MLFRRLNKFSRTIPRKMPARIDSHGKPGIGARVNGMDVELCVVAELAVL